MRGYCPKCKEYITQHVGEDDKLNIKEMFGRGQAFGKTPGSFMNQCIQELKNVGSLALRAKIGGGLYICGKPIVIMESPYPISEANREEETYPVITYEQL